ncbi:hypothetical protein PCE1_000195 [Barthelona sp. PCE]
MSLAYSAIEEPRKNKGSKTNTILLLLTVVLVVFNLVLIISRVMPFNDQLKNIDDNVHVLEKKHNILPEKVILKPSAIHPVSNQAHRGTCWSFATIGAFESAYKHQAIQQGFLDPDQYVKFSEQAHAISVVEECNTDIKKCPIANMWYYNQASDGYAVWLYTFQQALSKQILPNSVCPYVTVEDTLPDSWTPHTFGEGTLKCDGQKAAEETNPVEYEINNMKHLYTKDEIKMALLEREYVLPISTALFGPGDYVKCSTPGWAEMCLIRNVSCPAKIAYGEKCYFMQGKSGTSDGAFVYEEDDKMIGGHGMGVVGIRESGIIDPFLGREFEQGYYILRNSWDYTSGHSIQYLSGEISFWDELELCPMWSSPRNWIKCTRGAEHHEGFETIAGASYPWYWNATDMHPAMIKAKSGGNVTALGFNPDINYCVESAEKDSPKRFEVCFAESEDGSKKEGGEKLCLRSVNVDYLNRLLDRVDEYPENDHDNCGYWAFPLRYADEAAAAGAFWVLDFDIEFSKCSFAKNANLPECRKFDYTLLNQSTHRAQYATFETPLPWQKKW